MKSNYDLFVYLKKKRINRIENGNTPSYVKKNNSRKKELKTGFYITIDVWKAYTGQGT